MRGKFKTKASNSFTLIELLVVIAIIGVLAGLILAAAGGVRNQAARSQAKADISALEAALVRYQLDFGVFPHSVGADPSIRQSATNYQAGSQILFTNLMGRSVMSTAPATGLKAYLEPAKAMVATNVSPNYFTDPWGYAYGYRWDATNLTSPFSKSSPDLWSSGGQGGTGTQTNRLKWICNWIN